MELTLQRPDGHLFIRSVSPGGIQVVDETYDGPLVLSADTLLTDWPVQRPNELTEPALEPILALEPDVVLIGTGRRQVFPPPQLLMAFYDRGIGVEFMSTEAACRTFNVLVSEDRKVVAALMPIGNL